jgi:hypothetical protein
MITRPSHALRLAVVALTLTLGAGVATATENQKAEVVDGKTTTVTFDLGFPIDCAHEITVSYSPEDIACVLNAPKKTSKSSLKLKIRGKAVGSTTVCVMWSGANPKGGCSGSATVYADIEVGADLKVVVKEIRSLAREYTKDIKTKLKDGQKWFCVRLKELEGQLKAGEITHIQFNNSINDAIGGVGFGMGMAFASCLGNLSDEMGDRLIDAAVDEYLAEVGLGGAGSVMGDVTAGAQTSWEKFSGMLKKKTGAAISKANKQKGMPKVVSTGKFAHSPPGLENVAPPVIDGSLPGGNMQPPAFMGFYAYTDNEDYVGLRLQGLADPEAATVKVTITGQNGTLFDDTVITDTLGEYYDDKDFGQAGNPPFDPMMLNQMSTFDLFYGSGLAPGGDGSLPLPGPYRVEIKYPGATDSSVVFHVSLP